MAVLDLRRLERNDTGKLVGWGNGYMTEQSSYRNVPSAPVPSFVVDLRREIYVAVRNAERAVSRAEIAKLVQRKKSTWLNGLIECLVVDGHLHRTTSRWKNGVAMYFYEVAR